MLNFSCAEAKANSELLTSLLNPL